METEKANNKEKFWGKYDTMTIGDIMTVAAKGNDDLRERIVKHEQQGRNRPAVVSPLVSWNS